MMNENGTNRYAALCQSLTGFLKSSHEKLVCGHGLLYSLGKNGVMPAEAPRQR
jgi:hypothetical protein